MNRDEAPGAFSVAISGRNPSASACNGCIILDGSRPLTVDAPAERVDARKPIAHPYKLRMGLLAPAPEDLPRRHQLLQDARCGQIEESAAIGDLPIFFFYYVRAEEAEAALQFLQLLARHCIIGGLVGEVAWPLRHDFPLVSVSPCVRLPFFGPGTRRGAGFGLPGDFFGEKFGEEVVVVGFELLYVWFGMALGVEVVGVELANPLQHGGVLVVL